ncbi:DegV family protein, partial [Candidatus Parcubacteria bacterium]|nr:DegV family protein [Candidatus Parcubacteria bacterium]
KYKITVVPFKVDLGEMKNLPGNIYQKIKEAEKRGLKSFVTTSQPSPGDFLTAFKEKLKEFEEIICITVTSKHSGTFNSAIQAKSFLPEKEKIHVVDSMSVSSGEGLVILKAVNLIEKGFETKEILKKLKESILKTNLIFMLKDPKWAENSGRIPKILGIFLRKMQNLGFYPLLGIKKGKISLVGVKKNVKDMASALLDEFQKRLETKQKVNVAITHADNESEAKKLANLIKGFKNCEIKFINIIGEIVGGLAGPGAVTLAWQT